MFFEFIKFIVYSILIVLIAKYALVKILRNISSQLNLKPKTSIKNRWDNFVTIWLDNDFYEKYKDSQGLKGIRKEIKHNDRI